MSRMHLVLEDPSGKFWEGALVEDAMARQLAIHDVALIPVVPDLFLRNAVAGFFRRAWGSGWKLNSAIPQRCCPLIMYLVSNHANIHWRARLAAVPKKVDPSIEEPGPWEKYERPVGSLRLIADTSQGGTTALALASIGDNIIDFSKLPPPDENGGWTVGGTTQVSLQQGEGFGAMSMYGAGEGALVQWVAISQTN